MDQGIRGRVLALGVRSPSIASHRHLLIGLDNFGPGLMHRAFLFSSAFGRLEIILAQGLGAGSQHCSAAQDHTTPPPDATPEEGDGGRQRKQQETMKGDLTGRSDTRRIKLVGSRKKIKPGFEQL